LRYLRKIVRLLGDTRSQEKKAEISMVFRIVNLVTNVMLIGLMIQIMDRVERGFLSMIDKNARRMNNEGIEI